MSKIANKATVNRTIKAPIEEVYQMVTDDALMQRWMSPRNFIARSVRSTPEVGGDYRIEMEDSKGGIHVITGRYLEIKSPTKVSKEWIYSPGKKPDAKTSEGEVTFELRAAGDRETEITITHSNFSNSDEAKDVRDGWTAALDKLEKMFHR